MKFTKKQIDRYSRQIILKKIGTAARIDLKEQLKKPVHLELWVKVKVNWADSDKDLQSLGYDL